MPTNSPSTLPPNPPSRPYYFYATDAVGNAQWINLSCAHRIAITHPSGSPQEPGFTIYFAGGEEIQVTTPEEIADLTLLLEGANEEFKQRAKPNRKQ